MMHLRTFFVFILKVVDCRVCGDPNSVLRFAFIEFTDEGDACCFNFLSIHLPNFFTLWHSG